MTTPDLWDFIEELLILDVSADKILVALLEAARKSPPVLPQLPLTSAEKSRRYRARKRITKQKGTST